MHYVKKSVKRKRRHQPSQLQLSVKLFKEKTTGTMDIDKSHEKSQEKNSSAPASATSFSDEPGTGFELPAWEKNRERKFRISQ